MKNKKGFTLIELLVVIAIIGILSSVVVASLNGARDKGGDTAVKANLSNLRSQAALYFDDNNSNYGPNTGTSCTTAGSVFTDSRVASQLVAAEKASGGGSIATCANSTTLWVASVPLRDKTKQWCVDSSGIAKEASANTTTIQCGN
ncbi:MAG: type II secretion system protein [bacterium]|nr:type II secretion system protein [bacterium]